ncbi:MAG TPA: ABC transporter permease [Bacteroidia bacterium]|nr:ABC transporter permease [Bacteroidia bacterium]
MKQFLAFVRKEFLHIIRDGRTLLILFGIPVAQVTLFGYVLSNDIKDVPVAVLDNSRDDASTTLLSRISSSGYFHIDDYLKTENEIDAAFRQGKIKMAFVIPGNFSGKLYHGQKAEVEIVADATDINMASTLTSYAQSIIRSYETEINPGVQPDMQIVPQVRMTFNPELKSVYMFIPGVISIVMILISAMLTSITIAREKEMGTMEILMISPLKPLQIIIGKVLPYLVLSIINCTIILLMGFFIFGMPMNGNFLTLGLECILYITLALSLGILISSVANTQQTAMFASMLALMMPTMLLSGFVFPVENMPVVLQGLSYIMPAKYFIIILKGVMIKGSGIKMLWQPTLIMLGFTLFFLFVSLRRIKNRLTA